MNQNERTRELLMMHYQTYPDLQIRDIFKFIYQSAFGCEHLVSRSDRVTAYIQQEFERMYSENEGTKENPEEMQSVFRVDRLDGAYSRVWLSCLKHGLQPETLGRLFAASAQQELQGRQLLEEKLETAKVLVREKLLPFSEEDFGQACEEWKAQDYPAVHHSDRFRQQYRPSYRVIAERCIPFLPVFQLIDELLAKGPAVIAIEGGSASGKTTLSQLLQEIYDCNVFHMDDFFLQPHQRTLQRFAEPGGNVDRERFLEEVLKPLSRHETVQYRRFDCKTFTLQQPVAITPGALTIVEGAYSMHPELSGYYHGAVFLDIDAELQKKRIEKRNTPQLAERFFREWIPMEQIYFSKLQAAERCQLKLPITW